MARTWHTPAFASLPSTADPNLRMVGSTLMDEEQYRIERWESTLMGSTVYWRASVPGMEDYAALRKQRRAERRESWQAWEEPFHQVQREP